MFWCRCPVATKALSSFAKLTCHSPSCCHSLRSLHLPPAALPSLPGVARLRTERWSALTATGSHSLPTLRPRSSINIQNKKEKLLAKLLFLVLVPVTGVEPVQCFHRRILSPLRLPVPPHRQFCANILYSFGVDLSTENSTDG